MNKEKQKGITLIALIITIIVILILVAVTVSTAANSGLFDHAKDATNKWADEQNKEANIGDEVDALIDEHVSNYYTGDIMYDGIWDGEIGLMIKKTNEPTTFEKAYIEYNGQKIDISAAIGKNEEENYNYLDWRAAIFLRDSGIIESVWDVKGRNNFILIKDGISYQGIGTLESMK